jgi:hypothetical protein
MKKIIFVINILVITLVGACKKDSITTYDCANTVATYSMDIKPILDASCATSNCHSAAAKASGIDLSSYGAAKLYSANDKFIKSIQHISGVEKMPRGAAKLNDSEIKLIYCWTNNDTPQ